jgi:hypothetical protein
MDSSAEKATTRLDAPFWAVALVVSFGLASLGCLGFAVAHTGAGDDVAIMTTDDCPPPPDL